MIKQLIALAIAASFGIAHAADVKPADAAAPAAEKKAEKKADAPKAEVKAEAKAEAPKAADKPVALELKK